MKKLNRALQTASVFFATTLLLASSVMASPNSEVEVDRLFKTESVDAVISMAFETKSSRYTEFAQLFNLCQKRPNDERCGDEYKGKRTRYEVAKSNYGALLMVNAPEFRTLPMPEVNHPEFVNSLKVLGYLKSDLDNVSKEQALFALNQWLVMNDFEMTSDVFLMHALLVRAQELSQLLEMERNKA
ncbi:hypothetical protein L4C33_16895 [Vibrio makurazakiensis]|uniref:hypothetical protein n=1 Tax=Vibrio makurazakiensis TaxID=2910250 RepID=UPI003D098B4C